MAYYPQYTGSSVSIVNALASIGVNSSYTNRAQIALVNGITNYSGTAEQNTMLLNLLKQGRLIKPGSVSISSSSTTVPMTDTAKVVTVFSSGQADNKSNNENIISASPNSVQSNVNNNSKTFFSMFDKLTDKQKKALKIGAIVIGVGAIGYGVYRATRKSSASGAVGGRRKAKAALNGVSHRRKRSTKRTRKVNLV